MGVQKKQFAKRKRTMKLLGTQKLTNGYLFKLSYSYYIYKGCVSEQLLRRNGFSLTDYIYNDFNDSGIVLYELTHLPPENIAK